MTRYDDIFSLLGLVHIPRLAQIAEQGLITRQGQHAACPFLD
jgi:hypothetical protein